MDEGNETVGKAAAIRRILVAAQSEFANKGFEAANVQQIAHSAGVSIKLVYHYFSKKENLYFETMIHMAQEFFRNFDPQGLEAIDPIQTIDNFAVRYADFYLRNPEIGRLLIDQVVHLGRQIVRSRPLERMRDRHIDVLRRALAKGREMGTIREGVSADGLFFHLLITTLGYGTVIGLVDPLHLDVAEFGPDADYRRVVANAVTAFVRSPATFAAGSR